jgi:O-antigen/teichoic acid export membrane protein
VARIAATTAYGIVLFRLFPNLGLFRMESLHELPKLLHFGGWVTISQIVSPILVYLDRVLIASMVSLGSVTLYTVPYEAMTRLRVIPLALVGTLYPAFSERGGGEQRLRLERLYERSIRYLTLLLLPGLLYLLVLGSDLFGVWMGAAFARQIAGVVQILALGVLVNALAPVPYSLLQALGRPDLTGKFHLLELPVHAALCILLIPKWGILGAALASTIRFFLDSALLFWAVSKYSQCSLREFWSGAFLRILLLGGLLTLGLCAIRFLLHDPWERLGAGLVALGIAMLAGWFVGVDRAEKPRLGGVLKTMLGHAAS